MQLDNGEGPPDVFISYSHQDTEWVKQLAASLSNEVVNDRKFRVRIDEHFPNGRSLLESIETAVRYSKYLICVLSPDYVKSDWTSLEYQMKILDDPAGKKGLIIPILYRECEVPYSLLIRLCADFRKPDNFKPAYQRLCLALGLITNHAVHVSPISPEEKQKIGAGVVFYRSEPDLIRENLALNFFEIRQKPKYLWYAKTRYRAVSELLTDSINKVEGCFTLVNGKIWSFTPFSTSQLAFALDGNEERISFDEALSNESYKNIVIELLNKLLWMRLKNLGLNWDKNRIRYYFPPSEYGKSRLVPWPALKRSSERTVVFPMYRQGEVECYAHIAASMKFVKFGEHVGLQVLPTRVLTIDGRKTKGGPTVGPEIVKLLYKVHNNQFWLEVMFWLYQLHTDGKIILTMHGSDVITLSDKPLMSTMDMGIFGDVYPFLQTDYADRWKEWDTLEQEVNDAKIIDFSEVNGE